MDKPTVTDAPPLPHLSGPLPVPGSVKRARVALALSITGVGMFFATFTAAAFLSGKNSHKLSLPGGINGNMVVGLVFLASVIPAFVGVLLGITARKVPMGKAALIVGGTFASLWVLLLGIILITLNR